MPAKQTLAIFGATGNQGASVARTVLSSASLSQLYNVRAISRDPTHASLQPLAAQGAELVRADMDDASTLPGALAGVDTLFFLTTTTYDGNTRAVETRQAKAVCSAAVEAGVSYIIFSSMSHPFEISGGKLKNVVHFDDKAEIEQWIRGLPVKSAFFAPACFMQNFLTHILHPVPSREGDGSYVLPNCVRGETKVPFIDISETGKWVGAILAEPDKYAGKQFAAAAEILSMDEVAAIVSRVTGKVVKFQNVPDEVFKSFLPEAMREPLYEMWVLSRDYGYYGSTMGEDVAWARDNAQGELTGLEAFLRKHEYKLDQ
ncbi:hypothetical protein N0V95_010130 [Ascochyta clinopodiicola]|nr:hypothetical protein N0V95_010130 [Ascochyta clinopodiicola]